MKTYLCAYRTALLQINATNPETARLIAGSILGLKPSRIRDITI